MPKCSGEIKSLTINELLNYEKEQTESNHHNPLYYYAFLNNNTEITLKDFIEMSQYLLNNYTHIKILNAIVDKDFNGYSVFINSI